jgi:hypothetical protein
VHALTNSSCAHSPVPDASHSLTDRTAYLPAEAADR